MNRNDFTVIKGGLHSDITLSAKEFVSAYVTDTRLMGVLALYAHWKISGGGDLHQFFYIDCEEAGLETCRVFRGDFGKEAREAEQALVGGLGAQKISISEIILRSILTRWRNFNMKYNLPLPKNAADYDFVFDDSLKLDAEARSEIMSQICGEITNDYQVVNYFLMRCFGQDYEGARYLAARGESAAAGESRRGLPLADDFPLDLYDSYRKATFCRNVIDVEKSFSDGAVSYLCESLIEMEGNYETIISKVVVKNLKVIGFEHCSGFAISTVEAALMLKKPEFVSVYEVLADDDVIEDNIGEFLVSVNTVMTSHENGRLFMAYKSTNDHVSERIFMLSNDVKGAYFLTDFGQLIVMANSSRDCTVLDLRLASSPLFPYLELTSRYKFADPVLFEFINSGLDDFDDFQ